VTASKRKVSLSLDDDLVRELETADATLSAAINESIRDEVDRRRRVRALIELLDELDVTLGPLDEGLAARYRAALARPSR